MNNECLDERMCHVSAGKCFKESATLKSATYKNNPFNKSNLLLCFKQKKSGKRQGGLFIHYLKEDAICNSRRKMYALLSSSCDSLRLNQKSVTIAHVVVKNIL